MTGFADPISGGGILVQPEVRSPNFVHLVSGWIIRADGTAEFHGLVLTGGSFTGINFIITSAGAFYYSGTPAAGNLIASTATAGGTDAEGNVFLAGETSYANLGGFFGATNTYAGKITFWTAATEAGPWVQQALITGFAGVGIAGQTELVVQQGTVSVSNALFTVGNSGGVREWYPPSGGDDFAALDSALSAGFSSADLTPGTFLLSAQLPVAGATLQGCDEATAIKPFGGYAGALLQAGTKGVIRNLSIENSGSDAIQIPSGISEPWLLDLYFSGNAGWLINAPAVTAPIHARIRGIRGAGGGGANGGGINLDAGTGGAVTCEANIYDLDIQSCTATEVLRFQGITDALVSKVNGSVGAGVASNAISVLGACQTVHLLGLDVGGSAAGTAVAFLGKGGSVNSPTDCWVKGKLQAGAVGLVVNDAVARCRFDIDATRNQGDGAQFNGTGALNKLLYMGNVNNQAAGVAYDIDVTGSVHLYVDAPQCSGGAVTANCNITLVANHVDVVNPPAGFTFAGNPQAGW